MMEFERIDIGHVSWEGMAAINEVNVFQTLPWLGFVAETQKAEPVVAAIRSGEQLVGYFTGLIVSKYGIRILGSPFRGWATYFMGFNLMPGVSRREVLQALPEFAFKDLGCQYLEIVDPCLTDDDWAGLPYREECLHWFAIDLTKSKEELFTNMKSAGRNCIRKSIRSGVTIEEASDVGFVDEYYAQHTAVMARQSLAPTYELEHVRELVDRFLATGDLLLLRARDPKGVCVASGIFLALNKTAVFWGAASWREYQSLRPNEPLAWYGMQNLKARGVHVLHLGGGSEQYKVKLGCHEVQLHRLMKAKNKVLDRLLDFATSSDSARYRNWALRKL